MLSEAQIERFWSQVEKTDTCWHWTTRHNRSDRPAGSRALYYGTFWTKERSYIAYRLAYELTHGPIPSGLVVRHRCAVHSCCNPDHLVLGTELENTWDRRAREMAGVKPGELLTYEDFPDYVPRKFRH